MINYDRGAVEALMETAFSTMAREGTEWATDSDSACIHYSWLLTGADTLRRRVNEYMDVMEQEEPGNESEEMPVLREGAHVHEDGERPVDAV